MTTTAATTPAAEAAADAAASHARDPMERTLAMGAGAAIAAIAGAFAVFGLPGLVIVKLGMAVAGLAMVVLITRG